MVEIFEKWLTICSKIFLANVYFFSMQILYNVAIYNQFVKINYQSIHQTSYSNTMMLAETNNV